MWPLGGACVAILLAKGLAHQLMRTHPRGKARIGGGAHAFLQKRCRLAQGQDELVIGLRCHVHARVHALGKLRLLIERPRGAGVEAQDVAQHARSADEIKLVVGNRELGDERPRVGDFFALVVATAEDAARLER